jgi:MFS family permease
LSALSDSSALPPRLFTRDFLLFLIGLGAATLGIQIQATVVGYQLYEITRDPLSLGAIGLAEALPFVSLALLGGHVADAVDRRRVVVAAFAVMSLAAAALLAITWRRHLLSTGLLQLGIYGVIVLGGVCRAFLQPSRTALSAQIVPRALFPKAIAWRTGVFQLCAIVGPAFGGLLYGWVGASGAYVATVALLLAALVTMLGVRVPPRVTPPSRAPLLNSVGEGVRFLMADRILLGAITLDLFAVLFGGAVALLPVFAEDILKVGPEGFGLLRAAPAVGALAMTLLLARRSITRRVGMRMLQAVIIFGLGTLVFALSRNMALSLSALVVMGAADTVSVVIRHSLVQLRTPDAMRGRVGAVNFLFINTSNQLGEFESGMTAALFGTVPAAVLGGLGTIGVALLWMRLFPELRRVERLE